MWFNKHLRSLSSTVVDIGGDAKGNVFHPEMIKHKEKGGKLPERDTDKRAWGFHGHGVWLERTGKTEWKRWLPLCSKWRLKVAQEVSKSWRVILPLRFATWSHRGSVCSAAGSDGCVRCLGLVSGQSSFIIFPSVPVVQEQGRSGLRHASLEVAPSSLHSFLVIVLGIPCFFLLTSILKY